MMLSECLIYGVITFLMTGAQGEVTTVFAEVGSEAVLPCKHSPLTVSSPAIIWSKENKGTIWRMQKSGLQFWGASWSQKGTQGGRMQCSHTQFEKGDYSLQISSVTEEDGGIYSCSVETGMQLVQNHVILRVIKVTVFPSVPIWGRDVSLTCDITPWPYGASMQWMLNNSPFVTWNSLQSKRILREKASDRMSGKWTCVVSFKGEEGRASADVSVKGIIQPYDDNTKLYAAVGSRIILPCVFSADLTPSSPVWEKLKPGSHFSPVPSLLPPPFSPSSPSSQLPCDRSASLKEVRFEDEGRYRCSGIIHGQRQTRTMQLVVARIDSKISSKKKGSTALTCQLSDTSKVTDYEWVHVTYDMNGTQSVGSVYKGKAISISGEENQGEWTCRFYGKEGILGNVTHHAQLTSGLTGQKPSGSSYNTAAVVSLSFLLLILLLILMQMYKNHQRRKRILQYPALETIVHTISNEREERERSRMKK